MVIRPPSLREVHLERHRELAVCSNVGSENHKTLDKSPSAYRCANDVCARPVGKRGSQNENRVGCLISKGNTTGLPDRFEGF